MALLDISRLRIDGGTQHRARQNEDAIADYTEAYLDGKKMPPVLAVHDGEHYWLWEGFHRVAAAKLAGMKGIAVDLTKGTQRDAFRLSLLANATNGMRRSNDDKRNCVIAALQDAEFSQLSDREVAKLCGVGHPLVAALRRPEKTLLPSGNGRNSTLVGSTEKTILTGGNGRNSTPDMSENGESTYENTGDSAPEQKQWAPRKNPDEQADPPPSPKLRAVPLGSLEDITRERDDLRERLAEMGQMCQELTDEVATLMAITSSDDQVMEALAECRKERGLRRVAEERINGLMNEKNAAVRAANGWQRKAKGRDEHRT